MAPLLTPAPPVSGSALTLLPQPPQARRRPPSAALEAERIATAAAHAAVRAAARDRSPVAA